MSSWKALREAAQDAETRGDYKAADQLNRQADDLINNEIAGIVIGSLLVLIALFVVYVVLSELT